MNASTDRAAALTVAATLTRQAENHRGIPRWYAVFSTLLFLLGVGVVTVGVVVGWFVPFVGVVVLTLNAASFPFLLASWRVNGVIPRDGRLARIRYWAVTPLVLVVMLALWLVALTLGPASAVGVWLAIVVPFALEHANRLHLWWKR
ncbi:hypothetical protein [Rathayibacter tanaceti]|uniref:Uncharacterized protein n=2 Tax=Rathayibacter tanaceti TaxID=1671680 RepID=A0A162FZ12_9MICO|nr:hypothetical protein [Rathayibacter tanaceti]KZX21640.1 hypothetical protein ACH61_01242 [Rathayibacter tanaceti]QHC56501.1 hypothetical protein GSU10_13255 [Rathayibacter tanaceti]TCO36709.1 hypothetical protein EV639_106112 [Rathayibacter tanaceti]